MMSLFELNTTTKQTPKGTYTCSCDLGMWEVESASRFGALEDGKKAFDETLNAGHYLEGELILESFA